MEYLLVGIELLPLYQHFFPRDYQRQKINFGSGESVRDAIFRFSELVDSYLFPIWPFDCLDFIEEISNLAVDIPIKGSGFALDDREVDGKTTALDDLFQQYSSATSHEWQLFDDELQEACKRRRDPLRWLHTARSVCLGYTGNWYIDVDEQLMAEAAEFPSWSLQTVKYLAEDFREAQKLMKRYERFTQWVLAKPERMRQAEKLLKAHYRPRGQRIRVTTGAPLVEVLA